MSTKYCDVIPIIQFLHAVKGFQVQRFNTNNSIQYSMASGEIDPQPHKY